MHAIYILSLFAAGATSFLGIAVALLCFWPTHSPMQSRAAVRREQRNICAFCLAWPVLMFTALPLVASMGV
jgi:hypothetical protein